MTSQCIGENWYSVRTGCNPVKCLLTYLIFYRDSVNLIFSKQGIGQI